jgi:cell division protein FtsL
MNRVYIQSKQIQGQQPFREKDPVHFQSLMLIIGTSSLIVLGILSYIWRGVEIMGMGYKMRAVYQQRQVLQEQKQKLVLERASLRSMNRIEDLASSDLRLVRPDPEQIIIMPHHKTASRAKSDE